MLRTQRLVLHNIPSTTSDFEVVESFAPHKNNLIIDDFEVVEWSLAAEHGLVKWKSFWLASNG